MSSPRLYHRNVLGVDPRAVLKMIEGRFPRGADDPATWLVEWDAPAWEIRRALGFPVDDDNE